MALQHLDGPPFVHAPFGCGQLVLRGVVHVKGGGGYAANAPPRQPASPLLVDLGGQPFVEDPLCVCVTLLPGVPPNWRVDGPFFLYTGYEGPTPLLVSDGN